MTFGRLCAYIEMDREADPAYRAYDLLDGAGEARLANALRMAGYPASSFGITELFAHLNNHKVSVSPEHLKETLCEWYVWQRIADGVLHRWKLRQRAEGGQ